MTMNKADEWLTGKEAAEVLKLTVRSIEKHRAAGRLPFWKSETGSVRYRRSHVEALLKPSALKATVTAPKAGKRRAGATTPRSFPPRSRALSARRSSPREDRDRVRSRQGPPLCRDSPPR
jgi:excisionase family DNA binding protein